MRIPIAPSTALVALVLLATAHPSHAVYGVDDQIPAASLIVPFFEVGIDAAQNPHDTLPIVFNRSNGSQRIHWEMYNRDAARVRWGNVQIAPGGSWNGSFRDLIAVASAGQKAQLADGDFYRGFMTIDHVTSTTSLSPFDDGYPFANGNDLLGYVYYLRLAEGSANGLSMVHLEAVPTSLPLQIHGFYRSDDGREEIDILARDCARRAMAGSEYSTAVCNTDSESRMRIRSRVFRSDAVNGKTRVILFAWDTSRPTAGGPSAICTDFPFLLCPTSFETTFVNGGGSFVFEAVEFQRVVNIIEVDPSIPGSGEHIIRALEDPDNSMQVYAFAFNSAQPAGNPNINWDAIFPSSIEPCATAFGCP